ESGRGGCRPKPETAPAADPARVPPPHGPSVPATLDRGARLMPGGKAVKVAPLRGLRHALSRDNLGTMKSWDPLRRSWSRRTFLRTLGASGAALVLPRFSGRAAAAPPLFEELSPQKTGIAWVHENAMSPDRYLPETMGPGVAFLDYDNDGWMDL